MDASSCVDALNEAIEKFGTAEIFNTDQGSQFTSHDFTQVLKDNKIKISMDGKGCWVDNVFIERVWRSLKYEEVYLKAYESVRHARESIGTDLHFYNTERRHYALDRTTPDDIYYETRELQAAKKTKRRTLKRLSNFWGPLLRETRQESK